MQTQKRTELIEILNKIKCGLTQNEILEQSNSFVFKQNKIYAFNGELLAIADYDIGIEKSFAIIGNDLLKALEAFPEEEIKLSLTENELIIKGKNKRTGIAIFQTISLPYEEVPESGRMKKVKNDFFHELVQCARICGNDHTNPRTTHVHLTENKIEATDRYRVFRIDIETDVKKDMLVPADTILSIDNGIKIEEMCCENNWMYISSGKIRYSIRCSDMDYFNDEMLDRILKGEGTKGEFHPSVIEALERSKIMINTENDVELKIKKGAMKIKTQREGGWYEEEKKIKYTGKPISFVVNLNFLRDILNKTQTVIFSDGKIKIEKDNFYFATAIMSDGNYHKGR